MGYGVVENSHTLTSFFGYSVLKSPELNKTSQIVAPIPYFGLCSQMVSNFIGLDVRNRIVGL